MQAHTTLSRQLFAERLNQILSDADFSKFPSDRAAEFAKIFNLDITTAERIIDGLTFPSESLLVSIAEEFEVSAAWLSGQDKA